MSRQSQYLNPGSLVPELVIFLVFPSMFSWHSSIHFSRSSFSFIVFLVLLWSPEWVNYYPLGHYCSLNIPQKYNYKTIMYILQLIIYMIHLNLYQIPNLMCFLTQCAALCFTWWINEWVNEKFLKFIYISYLCPQHGVQTHDPKIKSYILYWLRQPGALNIF